MRNGWPIKRLGDLSDLVTKGTTPTSIGHEFVQNGINFVKVESISATGQFIEEKLAHITPGCHAALGRSQLQGGDILFSIAGALGRTAFVTDDILPANTNQALAIVRLKRDVGLSPKFVLKALETGVVLEQIENFKGGVAQQNLSLAQVRDFHIPLPSLPEQQRIVGILDEAFEGIATAKANAEKNLQNARALFESLLNVAIQGKLTPQDSGNISVAELISQIEKARKLAIDQGRAKAEKTEPVESQTKLPKGWKWIQLESLTIGISDGVHKKPHYASKGIPFITVKNLTAGPGISFDYLNYITQEDHKEFIKRTHPEKGDILITKDGTIGVVRLVDTDIEFSIFVSVALIKPVMQEIGPYLVYALRASCVQSQIVPQGTALKHLYLVDLRRLAIPLPPMSEQKRIVDMLDSLHIEAQRLESIYQRKLAALETLKESLLHQAFTGQL